MTKPSKSTRSQRVEQYVQAVRGLPCTRRDRAIAELTTLVLNVGVSRILRRGDVKAGLQRRHIDPEASSEPAFALVQRCPLGEKLYAYLTDRLTSRETAELIHERIEALGGYGQGQGWRALSDVVKFQLRRAADSPECKPTNAVRKTFGREFRKVVDAGLVEELAVLDVRDGPDFDERLKRLLAEGVVSDVAAVQVDPNRPGQRLVYARWSKGHKGGRHGVRGEQRFIGRPGTLLAAVEDAAKPFDRLAELGQCSRAEVGVHAKRLEQLRTGTRRRRGSEDGEREVTLLTADVRRVIAELAAALPRPARREDFLAGFYATVPRIGPYQDSAAAAPQADHRLWYGGKQAGKGELLPIEADIDWRGYRARTFESLANEQD